MQKTELIAQVAKATGKTQVDTASIMNAAIDAIIAELKAGNKVTLTGFGTFEVRKTAARTGTNPSNGQKIKIPAGQRAAFSAGAVLKTAVSGKKPAAKKPAAKKTAAKKPAAKKSK